jgi:hypothetical protein
MSIPETTREVLVDGAVNQLAELERKWAEMKSSFPEVADAGVVNTWLITTRRTYLNR